METTEELIRRCSEILNRAAVVTEEHIKAKSTKTTLKSGQEIIKSDDISAFYVFQSTPSDTIFASALVHRKLHAQVWFCTCLRLPLDEFPTNISNYCTCQFNSTSAQWCSHVIALMLLISNLQLTPFQQPLYDAKGWKPSASHPLSTLSYVRELSLPWTERVFIMSSSQMMYNPDRRRASLGTAKMTQTYQLKKNLPKKRGRCSASALISSSQSTTTTSWTRAIEAIRPVLSTTPLSVLFEESSNQIEQPEEGLLVSAETRSSVETVDTPLIQSNPAETQSQTHHEDGPATSPTLEDEDISSNPDSTGSQSLSRLFRESALLTSQYGRGKRACRRAFAR